MIHLQAYVYSSKVACLLPKISFSEYEAYARCGHLSLPHLGLGAAIRVMNMSADTSGEKT